MAESGGAAIDSAGLASLGDATTPSARDARCGTANTDPKLPFHATWETADLGWEAEWRLLVGHWAEADIHPSAIPSSAAEDG